MPTAQRLLLPAAGLAVGVASTLWLAHVRAAGIPTTEPLYYSGTLEDNGAPVTGTRDVTLRMWDDASDPATTHKKCETISATTAFDSGRFRIPLDATCQAAIAQNPDLWIEVVVGATSLGRKKVGAVPYAVEAQTAVAATSASGTLASQIVPAGAIMYFNGPCPVPGWIEFQSAQGRYIVGLTSGGTLSFPVGQALMDKENRATGQHTHGISESPHTHVASSPAHSHSITDPGHQHGIYIAGGSGTWYYQSSTFASSTTASAATAAATTGITVNGTAASVTVNTSSTGLTVNNSAVPNNVPGTNAPYIQLRVCQKI